MDIFGLITIPDWIALATIILVLLYRFFTWNYGTFEAMGIPNPKPWPVLGNLYTEYKSVIPELDIHYAKKYGNIYGTYDSRTPNLKVSDPDFVRQICIKEFSHFTDRRDIEMGALDPIFSLFLVTLKGEKWKLTRNVMTPTFTSGKLKLMIPLLNKCCKDLIENLREKAEKGESVDVKSLLIRYLLATTASCVFGMEIESQKNEKDTFSYYANRLTDSQSKSYLFILMFILPKVILKRISLPLLDSEALAYFKKMIKEMIELKKSQPEARNDFLQLMLDTLKKDNEENIENSDSLTSERSSNEDNELNANRKSAIKKVLTEDGIVANAVLFLFAGFNTLASTLTYTCYLLAIHQEEQQKLLKEVDDVLSENDGKVTYETIMEMPYMDMVLSEVLRLYPQAPRLERLCVKDCVINNIAIPKGMLVSVPVYAIHHNEEYYPNPKHFDPERFSKENKDKINPLTYLPFGIGPRNCIGMRFALMKMKVTLANILKEYQFVPGPKTEIPLKFRKGLPGLIPENDISVNLIRRQK